MRSVLITKKLDIDLARDEASFLFDTRPIEVSDNILVIDTTKNLVQRLSQTRAALRFLFKTTQEDLVASFKGFDWKKMYKESFRVRIHGFSIPEKRLAKEVWRKVEKPKVNLKSPKTSIECYISDGWVFVGILYWRSDQDFPSRNAHKRPFFYPSSIEPSLARCMINLSGIKDGTVFDPFCGSGGILIEAALMDLKIKGFDIDPDIVVGCNKNLKFFGIDEKAKVSDSTKISESFDYCITDLPYMKNTKGTKVDLHKLYDSFFGVLEKNLKKRAVIGMLDIKMNIPKNLEVVSSYSIYIHKSLSKKIIVLNKKG